MFHLGMFTTKKNNKQSKLFPCHLQHQRHYHHFWVVMMILVLIMIILESCHAIDIQHGPIMMTGSPTRTMIQYRGGGVDRSSSRSIDDGIVNRQRNRRFRFLRRNDDDNDNDNNEYGRRDGHKEFHHQRTWKFWQRNNNSTKNKEKRINKNNNHHKAKTKTTTTSASPQFFTMLFTSFQKWPTRIIINNDFTYFSDLIKNIQTNVNMTTITSISPKVYAQYVAGTTVLYVGSYKVLSLTKSCMRTSMLKNQLQGKYLALQILSATMSIENSNEKIKSLLLQQVFPLMNSTSTTSSTSNNSTSTNTSRRQISEKIQKGKDDDREKLIKKLPEGTDMGKVSVIRTLWQGTIDDMPMENNDDDSISNISDSNGTAIIEDGWYILPTGINLPSTAVSTMTKKKKKNNNNNSTNNTSKKKRNPSRGANKMSSSSPILLKKEGNHIMICILPNAEDRTILETYEKRHFLPSMLVSSLSPPSPPPSLSSSLSVSSSSLFGSSLTLMSMSNKTEENDKDDDNDDNDKEGEGIVSGIDHGQDDNDEKEEEEGEVDCQSSSRASISAEKKTTLSVELLLPILIASKTRPGTVIDDPVQKVLWQQALSQALLYHQEQLRRRQQQQQQQHYNEKNQEGKDVSSKSNTTTTTAAPTTTNTEQGEFFMSDQDQKFLSTGGGTYRFVYREHVNEEELYVMISSRRGYTKIQITNDSRLVIENNGECYLEDYGLLFGIVPVRTHNRGRIASVPSKATDDDVTHGSSEVADDSHEGHQIEWTSSSIRIGWGRLFSKTTEIPAVTALLKSKPWEVRVIRPASCTDNYESDEDNEKEDDKDKGNANVGESAKEDKTILLVKRPDKGWLVWEKLG